jgi:tetratricopeptide (TPR) repeat protein
MFARLTLTPVAAALALLAIPTLAETQDGGRLRVLVPYFEARQGAETNFGEQATEDLREMMARLPFHVAVDEDEMEEMAERFRMDVEDIGCTEAIQLATQVNIPVVICGNYTQDAQRNVTLNASIRTIQSNDEFALSPINVPRNGRQQAAQQIIAEFERYNTVIRAAQICQDYVNSQQWESALRNCDESLAINPDALSTRFLRARILFEMQRLPEALEDFDKVLERDPLNDVALQTAGYIATQLGDDERGRGYYRRYLDVNPGNVAIRLRIASEMAEAGDAAGAMEFIEPGLEVNPNDPDLLLLKGSFAFMGAVDAQQNAPPGTEGLPPAAAEYYRTGIETFLKLYEIQGDAMTLDNLRNIVLGYMQLEDYQAVVSMAERIFQRHPDDTALRSLYADALKQLGRQEDAYAAIDRLIELQPDNESAHLRKGTWLIAERRLEDAAAALARTATDQQKADNAANLIFNEAYSNGFQRQDWAYSIRGMVAAKNMPNISTNMREQLNFWHGFSVFQRTIPLMPAQDPALADARAAQPGFQEAKQLFEQAGSYPTRADVNMAALMDGVNQYLEICEIIIRRGY